MRITTRLVPRLMMVTSIVLAFSGMVFHPQTAPPTVVFGQGSTIYYVDGLVAQSGDGMSWATAWKTIGEATNANLPPGTTVLVWPGTYPEDMTMTSSGAEIVPLTTGITISGGNRVTFPPDTDLSMLDLDAHPGQYYLYLARSWQSNNGVFQITSVNVQSRFVEVAAVLFDEQGSLGDANFLSASIGQPMIYRAASTGTTGERVVLDASSNPEIYTMLYVGDYIDDYHANPTNYTIVDGFDLTGSHQGGGVHIQNSSFNVVMNSRIYDLHGAGVLINGHANIPAQYNYVIGCEIYNTPDEGVYIGAGDKGDDLNHTHFNHVIDTDIYTQGSAANAQMENAVDVKEFNHGTVIEGTTMRDFALLSNSNGALDIRNQADATLAYGNRFHNIRSGGNDTEYIINVYTNTQEILIANNLIFNDMPAGDGVYALNVHANETHRVTIAHNTISNIDNGLLLQYSTPDGTGEDNGVSIINNIVAVAGTTPLEEWTWNGAEEGHVHLESNLFSVDPDLDAYPVAADDIGDPAFVDAAHGNLRLTDASSGARDRGVPLEPAIDRDFDLYPRSDGVHDRGAYEYRPGTRRSIPNVQGRGNTSPDKGKTVLVQGVVTADFQRSNELDGFFLQDSVGDHDPLTSDGIFVYDPGGTDVNVGDLIEVKGIVSEHDGLTQIGGVDYIVTVGTAPVPAPSSPSMPEAINGDLEQYEGMLVQFALMTIVQNHFLGHAGQMTLSACGRLYQPTQRYRPGTTEQINEADKNARCRLVLDDGSNIQNPDLVPYLGAPQLAVIRAGDTITNLIGVLDEGAIDAHTVPASDYRLHPLPTALPTFTTENPRTTAPEAVGGTLTIASFEVLRYITLFEPGDAGNLPMWTRQHEELVRALLAINADVVGLIGIEQDAHSTLETVLEGNADVQGVNDIAGVGTYASLNTGIIGTDNTSVALIYKPATVTPVGTYAILDSTVDERFIDTMIHPVLSQTFEDGGTGERLTVVVNHFTSTDSPCDTSSNPDTDDGQGTCNTIRTSAAEAEVEWLATDPTGSGDPDILILGNLNAYAQEDPITTITTAGYTNMIEQSVGTHAYTCIFDGIAGYLDYMLASGTMAAQVMGGTAWHIKSDERPIIDDNTDANLPGLSIPHDPLVVGVTLDSRGPDAPSPPDMLAATDTGSSDSDNLTNDVTPIFTGTAEPTSTVRLYGDRLYGSAPADIRGTWTITLSTALAEGTQTLTATATDAVGNVSAPSSTLMLTIDTTAPDAPDVTSAATTHRRLPIISGTADVENVITVAIAPVSGTAVVSYETTTRAAGLRAELHQLSTGDWTVNLATDTPTSGALPEGGLPDGTHTVTVVGHDTAGNASVVTPQILIVDGSQGAVVYLPLVRCQ